MNISISIRAAETLNARLGPGQFVRVEVREGGCAGLTYHAEIVEVLGDNEIVVHDEGRIKIITAEESAALLDGLMIDYSDDLINGGLQFTNSNTRSTCGCGQSFSLSGFPEIKGGNCRH